MQVNHHPSLLLIGAGQIGSRYLQGLSFYKYPLTIYVVDPSLASLELAKKRFLETSQHPIHNISYLTSINSISADIDVAFITTPANCRLEVISNVVSRLHVRYWILEKVLAQSAQHAMDISSILVNSHGAWVNTPRRLMAWHKSIKDYITLNRSDSLSVHIIGGSWSLACNAIHFIDYVSWLSDSVITTITSDQLQTWFPSKRKGFYEVFGDISVSYADNTSLHMSCSNTTESMIIKVSIDNELIVIDEQAGLATSNKELVMHGELTFQSSLTSPLLTSILTCGTCDLPSLSVSVDQHVLMLNSLLEHWNRVNFTSHDIVPIT